MSNVKERIFGAVTIMSDEDAAMSQEEVLKELGL